MVNPWEIPTLRGQALQQCLRFWPGEALLLRALAQSALRLGDLPRRLMTPKWVFNAENHGIPLGIHHGYSTMGIQHSE